jgi:dihydroflavonol-4-reductase
VPGDQVFLTGATGFIGSHVLSALLGAGYRVRALVRSSPERLERYSECTPIVGDLEQPGALVPDLRGCRYLVHVAAVYSFTPRDRARLRKVNVLGTAGILEASRIAGVEKAVVTSSSATVGPAPAGRLATEDDYAAGDGSGYHHSKVEQERVALAARMPVVLVLPTAPVGANDSRPTPTGKMIVDFMRGRIFATLNGGLNLVPVEDVARGHVLALERGRPRERYLLGGENLTLTQIFRTLAGITGRRPPRRHLAYGIALAIGWADEVRCRALGSRPLVPIEGVRMARQNMWCSSQKAAGELGWSAGPVTPALERAIRWYQEHGYA